MVSITDPEASTQNQMFGSVRYDEGRRKCILYVATNPEQTLSIEFSFHDEKMGRVCNT